MEGNRSSPRTGFDDAEQLEAVVVEDRLRRHVDEVRDLVRLADFLAPELGRQGGPDAAAAAVTEWADGDWTLLAEAEGIARGEHHEWSAQLLAHAVEVATAA
jgi:hypothetical protein